jgi:hypothetical protein
MPNIGAIIQDLATMKITRFAAPVAVCALALVAGSASAAISLPGTTYTQDFNGLASSGINQSTLPAGWDIVESGGGQRDNDAYSADTGSSNTGDTYSYGAAGSSDRALGSLASGSLETRFGGFFANDTGGVITAITLDYFGEQWRRGTTALDTLNFQYSLDATSAANGTWEDFNALDFNSIINTGTARALNGNAAANRVAINGTIPGLSIGAGQVFGIRWVDTDSSGSDDGMAIDDLTMTLTTAIPAAVPEPASWAMMLGGFGLVGGALRRRRTTRAHA